MPKKITSKSVEKMLLDYAARKRIADMDFGTYFSLRSLSTDSNNPCAQAKANPGVRVEFEILAEPRLTGSVVWESPAKLPIQTTRLNSTDFWLEPESALSTINAAGARDDEDRWDRENEFDVSEDLAPQQLDGEFRFTLDSDEYKVFDIQTTPPDGTPPSIDVVQPNGKIDIDGKRGKKNLSNPDSTLEARVVKKSKGGNRRRDPKRSETKESNSDPASGIQRATPLIGPWTTEQLLYIDLITECYERYKQRWYRDKEMGEDACQEGFISFFRYILRHSPSTYSVKLGLALEEARIGEDFTSLARLFKRRIKSRRIDFIRKRFGKDENRRYETSIDHPLAGDQEGISLAETLVGREGTPDQALIIDEDVQRQGNVKDSRIARALEALTAGQRQALLLSLEPNTYEECARRMGTTLKAIKGLLNRAKVRLKKILNEGDA
jgi:RNA polymerase sigma factor (sigma-70 family)